MKRLILPLVALMSMMFMSAQCESSKTPLFEESEDLMSAIIDGVQFKSDTPVTHIGLTYTYYQFREGDNENWRDWWNLYIPMRIISSSDRSVIVMISFGSTGLPQVNKKYYELSDEDRVSIVINCKEGDTNYFYHSKDAWIEITDLEFIGDDCKASGKFGSTAVDVNTQKEIVVTDGIFEDYYFDRYHLP